MRLDDRDARSDENLWSSRGFGVCGSGALRVAPGNEPVESKRFPKEGWQSEPDVVSFDFSRGTRELTLHLRMGPFGKSGGVLGTSRGSPRRPACVPTRSVESCYGVSSDEGNVLAICSCPGIGQQMDN